MFTLPVRHLIPGQTIIAPGESQSDTVTGIRRTPFGVRYWTENGPEDGTYTEYASLSPSTGNYDSENYVTAV